jgi:hypothetical protein
MEAFTLQIKCIEHASISELAVIFQELQNGKNNKRNDRTILCCWKGFVS